MRRALLLLIPLAVSARPLSAQAPHAAYLAGLEAASANDPAAAERALAEYLASGAGAPAERARALYLRARLARAGGRPARAGEWLLEAKALDPELARERDFDGQWRALAAGARTGERPRLTAAQVFVLPGDRPLGATLDGLQAAGFDTVILRCFQLRGDRYHAGLGSGATPRGVYFRTDVAPVVAPLLETVSAAARARGLRVIAWITTRSGDFLPGAARDRYLDPESGELRDSDRLDLFDPDTRDRLHRLTLDALAAGADGILFQDDLAYRSFEGFSPRGLRALAALPGAPTPHSLFTRLQPVAYAPAYGGFAAVKSALVTRFLGESARLVHERRPDALVLANVYYDSVLNPEHGRDWLAQDLPGALAAGADYLSVMAYAGQIAAEKRISPVQAGAMVGGMPALLRGRFSVAPERLLFKLQTVDWATGEPLDAGGILALFHALESGGHSLGFAPAPSGDLLERLKAQVSTSPDY